MNTLFNLLMLCIIIVFWFLANTLNKPVLNKMMNYYEEDQQGKVMTNLLIAFMLMLAFLLGTRMF